MIEQQLGFSLESFLRGIVGIATVLGVAYLMSYDRKRVDWKLVGGGLFMQFVFALCIVCPCSRNCSGMGGQGFY